MQRREEKRDAILDLELVRPTASNGGYAHVRLRPCYREDKAIRSFVYGSDQARCLKDLVISCQIDGRSGTGSYGWTVEYRPHSVGLDEARTMVKTLATIQRKLESLAAEHGRPLTYGQYVTRVAMALGAKEVIDRIDGGVTSWKRGEIAYVIDHRVDKLHEECVRLTTGRTA